MPKERSFNMNLYIDSRFLFRIYNEKHGNGKLYFNRNTSKEIFYIISNQNGLDRESCMCEDEI